MRLTEAHSQDIHWWVKTADWQSVKTAGGLFKELHCLFWSFTVKNMKRVILTWLFPSGIWSWLVSLFDRVIKNTSKKTNSLDIWQTKGQELTVLEDVNLITDTEMCYKFTFNKVGQRRLSFPHRHTHTCIHTHTHVQAHTHTHTDVRHLWLENSPLALVLVGAV